jgi:uncharacterized membrane protein (UPF0127 family)
MSENTKLIVLFLFVFVLILVMGLTSNFKSFFQGEEPYVVINNQKIYVEMADSPERKEQGLSGRESLAEDRGMLFIYDKPGNYSFWMKEMKFNLDFVFINDQKVVGLKENIPFPQGGEEPQTIKAEADFDQVLEINQGMIEKWGIKIGDEVVLPFKPSR